MDKATTPETGTEDDEKAWYYSVRPTLDLFREHRQVSTIHINLPYVFEPELPLFWKPEGDVKRQGKVYHMVAGMSRHKNKLNFFLEMRISGILIDSSLNRKKGFSYRTYKVYNSTKTVQDEVVITRNLATTKPEEIKKQAEILFVESKRFYIQYFDVDIKQFVFHNEGKF